MRRLMARKRDGGALAGDGRPIVGEIGPANLLLYLERMRRTFSNWPAVFARLALASLGLKRGDIATRERSGSVLRSPATRSSWWPIYEMLAEDLYRLGALAGPELAAGEVIVDVGAHLGASALALSKRFPAARLLCAEPNPVAFSYLKWNVSSNRLPAELLNVAVGASAGRVTLYGSDDASCEASTTFERPGRRLEVEMVPFARLVAEAPGPVRVVKLDCEGAEHEIVASSPAATWDDVYLVLLEYHSRADEAAPLESLERRLDALGFECFWQVAFHWRPGLGMAGFRRRSDQSLR